MQTIYYSIAEMHPRKWVSIALVELPNSGAAAMGNETTGGFGFHESKEAAELFVKEQQKPLYYMYFGAGYELEYCAPQSDKLIALIGRWEKYSQEMTDILNQISRELNQPWWRKIFKKIIGFLKP